ncbi:hypothetical protein [Herbaspirillum rubrisubalbicans]|uniref:hypothetical protein n=1 Tax=Herbaspirillum rubrisubalbicans TaxID=80842 RepID=UPI00148DFE5D|nr:hypothetical protein [Herbaspirillum rubrisubalbicans]
MNHVAVPVYSRSFPASNASIVTTMAVASIRETIIVRVVLPAYRRQDQVSFHRSPHINVSVVNAMADNDRAIEGSDH